MTMKKQCYLIDIFKLIFCLCVIAIHTSLLKNCPNEISFWINQLFFRLAVPFFFIASGYMLGRKIVPIENDNSQVWPVIKKYCVRQLKLLVCFELIILLLNASRDMLAGVSVAHIALKSAREVIFYPRGALWFLQACIIGSLIYYVFIRFKIKWMVIPVGAILYMFALICNSYNFMIEGFPLLKKLVEFYLYVCLSARNGIFVGFLFIALGIFCFELKENKAFLLRKKISGFFCVLFFFLYVLELFLLKNNGAYPGKDDFSLFVSLPVFLFFFVCFLSYYEKEKNQAVVYCRNLSVGMYLLHAPISLIIFLLFHSYEWYSHKVFCFLLVSFISLLVCAVAYKRGGTIASFLR